MKTHGQAGEYRAALDCAHAHASGWLESLPTRAVGPQMNADELFAKFSAPLQEQPIDAGSVVDELARLAEPGLMAMPSGRFFGWVIGGTLPAAMAADWLGSAWDQNAAMRYATPATAAAEEAAGVWLLDLLGLPAGADVGFATGATGAHHRGWAHAWAHAWVAGCRWDIQARRNRHGLQ